MNEVGMLIDVSHCGDRTTLDAIELSPKPIAITHSNCRALNNHPRLKTDEAIRKLAAKGGVMGITGVRMFVQDKEPTTVEHIVDHIDHVVKLVGIEHVGIGSDSDLIGYDDMPAGSAQASCGPPTSPATRSATSIDTDGFDHPQESLRPDGRADQARLSATPTSRPCSAAISGACSAVPGHECQEQMRLRVPLMPHDVKGNCHNVSKI